jgi:restriction system protein
MPVPEFHRFLRPVLEVLADGRDWGWKDVEVSIAGLFHLTQEERDDPTPSGKKTRLSDRVQWACTYLRQAKLLENQSRGIYRITKRGLDYLKVAPNPIKPNDLTCFPEFADFQRRTRSKATGVSVSLLDDQDSISAEKQTPAETMDAAYQEHREALAEEILQVVKSVTPAFFEQAIVQLMLKLGYGGPDMEAGKTLGRSGDGGIDGVINQDKLGLDKIYLQAKRWDNGSVGSKEIQAFVGALSGQGATKGVFITTSSFSKSALEYARSNKSFTLSLIDGLELSRLMIEYDLGVALVKRYDVKRVDSDFFEG